MVMGRDASEVFEFDRSQMVRQLRGLRREIDESADEMEMIAAERVFREPLSRALVREAGKLHVTARELTSLRRLVERAQMPKALGKPESKAVPHARRKTPG